MTSESDDPATGQRRPRGRPSSVDRTAALEATRRVIAQRGLDRTRYGDIAEESGVAVSTLQHAFGRLDEILGLALDHAQDLDAEFLATLPARGSAPSWDRIETFVTGSLASPLPTSPDAEDEAAFNGWLVWLELWRAAARDPSAARRTTRAYDRWWAAAEEIIRDGQDDGSFTRDVSARELAIAVNAILDGAAVGLLLRSDQAGVVEAQRIALMATRRTLAV